MNRNKKALYGLMENYFYYCETHGFTDFEMWCEDNLENDEQESLAYEMKEHVSAIAGLLF